MLHLCRNMHFQVLQIFQEGIHNGEKLTTLTLVNREAYIWYLRLLSIISLDFFFIIGFIFPCSELYNFFRKFH